MVFGPKQKLTRGFGNSSVIVMFFNLLRRVFVRSVTVLLNHQSRNLRKLDRIDTICVVSPSFSGVAVNNDKISRAVTAPMP